MSSLKIIFLLFCLMLLFPKPASAHDLQIDGNIAAIMHIDPVDDPIANQLSSIFFEFKDTQNQFQPDKCLCKFSLTRDGQEVYSQDLFSNGNYSLSPVVNYTFKDPGSYEMQVSGQPTTPNLFQSFNLQYDVDVSAPEKKDLMTYLKDPKVELVLGIIGLVAVAIIIYLIIR